MTILKLKGLPCNRDQLFNPLFLQDFPLFMARCIIQGETFRHFLFYGIFFTQGKERDVFNLLTRKRQEQ